MANPIANWRKRHRNTTNFWLHMMGIPACFIAAPTFLISGEYWMALAMFVGGYTLQFIGHLVEGNRSGEEMLVRRILEATARRRRAVEKDKSRLPRKSGGKARASSLKNSTPPLFPPEQR
jgi:hypothetical protein